MLVPIPPLPLIYFGRLPLFVLLSFSLSVSPFAVLRFFFPWSATPPPRATLASFTSFCRRRRRRCHSRERSAFLPPCGGASLLSTPSIVRSYVRLSTQARTHTTCGPDTQKKHVVVVQDIYRVVHRDAFSLRLFSRPPAALSLSLFSLRSSSCPSIALPFTSRSWMIPTWEHGSHTVDYRSGKIK